MISSILIAPYGFKGTLSAREVANAVALGIRDVMPDANLYLLPLGDGGAGTLDALITGSGGEYRSALYPDATGLPRQCSWGMLADGTAVIEAARVIALADVPDTLRDPSRLVTTGLGELILHALQASPAALIIGLGDTATHDCGLGIGAALGYRFLDRNGRELVPAGRSLPLLAAIDSSHAHHLPDNIRRTIFCDVINPLLGPDGAALRFASQKGADAGTVELLEKGSGRFAEIVKRDLGKSIADIPGAGAAGGLGAGLAAFLGAELVSGADGVLDAVGFDDLAAAADLIITGEGMLDAKTLLGKGVGRVADRARRQASQVMASRVMIVAGKAEGDSDFWEEKLGAIVVQSGEQDAGLSYAEQVAEAVRRRSRELKQR